MHKFYYMFFNKDKNKDNKYYIESIKIYSQDDISAEDLVDRYKVSANFVFRGIFDTKTHQFVSRTPKTIED